MKSRSDLLGAVLKASSRHEIEELLHPPAPIPTLPEVSQIIRSLKALPEARQKLKVAILRTYASELLRPYWELESLLKGFDLELHEAPFGVLAEEAGAGLASFQPDLTVLLLQWEDLDPQFGRGLAGLGPAVWKELTERAVQRLESLLTGPRRAATGLIAVTLLPPLFGPGLGQFDSRAMMPESYGRAVLKHRIAGRLQEAYAGVVFDDLDEMALESGRRNLTDARLWYSSRSPFSRSGAQALVQRLMAYAVLLKHPRVKVIVLDGDNTLWGGVLGEEGLDGIALGPDYPGSAYVAFQFRLRQFQRRGILLALCTKNNPDEVVSLLKTHPHQMLREEDFAAMRINWQPKVENLQAMAKELNLGLDAFLFVDDSPHECFQVREHLPQVRVIQTPAEPVDIPNCLDGRAWLEILNLTEEDVRRTALYSQERERRKIASQAPDFGQYLQSLQMAMTVAFDEPAHLKRIAQLTQKTNQFNLTTRRCTEAEIEQMMNDPAWLVADFSLRDVFGDSGIVGLALVRGVGTPQAEMDAFLMSCRVIGRGAETAFLNAVLQECGRRGSCRVRGMYVPSGRNEIVKSFWLEQGFVEIGQHCYDLDLAKKPVQTPGPIRVELASSKSNSELPLGVGAGRAPEGRSTTT